METNKTILVPWDFTHVAECAYDSAVSIAKAIDNTITLVHIVKKASEADEVSPKLQVECQRLQQKSGVVTEQLIREGTIFTSISEVADELEASFIFMGTHGMKGMQKITGSWALKVITKVKMPSVIVQDESTPIRCDRVVIPLNFKKENKETVTWIHYLAKHFNSRFVFFHSVHTDQIFKRGLESNLIFIKKFCDAKGIRYELEAAAGKKDFAKEVIEYSTEIKADMIMTMTTKDISLADYVLGAHEQFIIANDSKIPVLCVNPKPAKNVGGFRTAGG